MTDASAAPYVSLVVTTRNDDHGGDPLLRLHALLETFAAQCARAALDAEVIVVEWNPPPGRPRVSELLRVPRHAPFPVRVIEVPRAVHDTFRHAAVLPLFQMIAKNAGIRRARGRFVLATNIDIILSNALVGHLASGQLAPAHLYRVDRHDIEAAFPLGATLDEQMAYCETHQIRLHTRHGSQPVDPGGRVTTLAEDVVGSSAVRLGDGWHVREGDAVSGYRRWIGPEAHVSIDRTAAPELAAAAALYVEVAPNPYQPGAWVDIEIADGDRRLAQRRLTARTRLRVRLDDAPRHDLVIRSLDSSGGRDRLPLFERRDPLCCVVHHVGVRPLPLHEYELTLWRRAVERNREVVVEYTPGGVAVTTDAEPYSYAVRYAAFAVPEDGTYEFALECALREGHCVLSVMDDARHCWLPANVVEAEDGDGHVFHLTIDLRRGMTCSLFISNDRPAGGRSHLRLHRLCGSVPLAALIAAPERRRGVAAAMSYGRKAARLRRLFDGSRLFRGGPRRTGGPRVPAFRGDGAPAPAAESDRVRELDAKVRSLAALADLAPLAALLREHRPAIYQNAAGDFQLMARDDWFALRGYPELEMFSMNIDGLFEAIAHAAGIREEVWALPLCTYHLEHGKGSGWTPEGEALLEARIAAAGVTWLDAGAVQILSAYMEWLRRPMIFNGAGWGLGDLVLQERLLRPPGVSDDPAPR